jgi:hypothetical protein
MPCPAASSSHIELRKHRIHVPEASDGERGHGRDQPKNACMASGAAWNETGSNMPSARRLAFLRVV